MEPIFHLMLPEWMNAKFNGAYICIVDDFKGFADKGVLSDLRSKGKHL